jgi:hypothetical protein
MRHEDVDQHHVERRCFKRADARFAAVGDGHLKALALQTDLDGRADQWIVIDHENTWHRELLTSSNHRLILSRFVLLETREQGSRPVARKRARQLHQSMMELFVGLD